MLFSGLKDCMYPDVGQETGGERPEVSCDLTAFTQGDEGTRETLPAYFLNTQPERVSLLLICGSWSGSMDQ